MKPDDIAAGLAPLQADHTPGEYSTQPSVPDEWVQRYACQVANVAAFVESCRGRHRSTLDHLRELDAAGLWYHENHPLLAGSRRAAA